MLNEEELMLQKMVDEWVKDNVFERGYKELEPKGEFPTELLKDLADMDLVGMAFPEKYGGSAASTVATSIVAECLASGWPSLHLIWSASSSLAGYPITRFGLDWQKQKYLPGLASGEILGCYALTEPDAGSDAAAIKMTARFDKESFSWILNGTKTFITNALDASLIVVFARVSREDSFASGHILEDDYWRKRHAGITAFVVGDLDPGLKTRHRGGKITVNKISKWGLSASPFAEVVFEDVEVGTEEVLGEIGKGFHVAMDTLNNGRINIASQAVGIARRALYEAEEYASQRRLFDATLIKIPVQARRLARLKKMADEAWELTLHASRTKDSGADYRVEASKAKLFASETAVKCAMFNYRIHGGMGCTKECIAMSILHDALATVTYEGTSDIQRLTIKRGTKG